MQKKEKIPQQGNEKDGPRRKGGHPDVVVVGAGAAGLMAACAALDAGSGVMVLERNEKAGKKIFITGKGRCNYTNACSNQDFFANVLRNPRFLYSAVYGFDGDAMTQFLEENGCPTKRERGGRCFPASDKAYCVTDALTGHIRNKGGKIRFHSRVKKILVRGNTETGKKEVTGVLLESDEVVRTACLIIATGGLSYPSTGSTGDGFCFAKDLSLPCEKPFPSLVPLVTKQDWPKRLQGLSLKNVAVWMEPRVLEDGKEAPQEGKGKKQGHKKKKPLYEGFGELLFTHFGLSGPIILSASCHTDFEVHPQGYTLHLDLKPSMSADEVRARIMRECSAAPKKELPAILRTMEPERLARELCALFMAEKNIREIPCAGALSSKQLAALSALLKDLPVDIVATRGFEEAICTRGGISVSRMNPSTMEVRDIKGLYFAGEVLDVDAYTGGFNLQIAWSTGHLAGESAARASIRAKQLLEKD